MSEWQPIETAPKDGTRILLHTRWDGDEITPDAFDEVQIGWWDDGNALDDPASIWHRPARWELDKVGDPIHWMPLPEPPHAD